MSIDQTNPAPESPPEATGPSFRSPAAEQQFRAVAGDHLAALDRLPASARSAALQAMATSEEFGHYFAPVESETPAPPARSPKREMADYLRQHHGPPGSAAPASTPARPTPVQGQGQAGSLRDQMAGFLRQHYGAGAG
jgi:hypothetical protein